MKFINWERKGNFKFDVYSETIALSHSHLVSLDHNVYAMSYTVLFSD